MRRRLIARPVRLTPAYAGKTSPSGHTTGALRAHPRVCGEDNRQSAKQAGARGSPPRMRGRRRRIRVDHIGSGLTPAYAGKTTDSQRNKPARGAHPRVCGEDRQSPIATITDNGSPPRMRGRRPARCGLTARGRLTPAYAGKTRRSCPPDPPTPAHPRVCGEDSFLSHEGGPWTGSPPRMRGRLPIVLVLKMMGGLTPAYAGKTRGSARRLRRAAAHPRVCGEDVFLDLQAA